MKVRKVGIDLLRALSILYIVGFWHLLNYTHAIPDYQNMITDRLTWIILSTFVFISGYLISGNFKSHNINLKTFYKKRFVRIYPPYVLALMLFTLLGLSDIPTSIKAFFSLSMFLKPAPPTLWFITMIIVFYFLAPLFIITANKNKFAYIGLYALLIISLYIYKVSTSYLLGHNTLDIRLAVYLGSFMLGVYLSQNKIFIKDIYIWIIFVSSIILSIYFETKNQTANLLYSVPLVTISSYMIFRLFFQIKIYSEKINKFIYSLSFASYFMYLFHRPIYITMKNLYFPEQDFHQVIYLVAICLPLVFAISYFLQLAYDKVIVDRILFLKGS